MRILVVDDEPAVRAAGDRTPVLVLTARDADDYPAPRAARLAPAEALRSV
jgi:hypothetical protein